MNSPNKFLALINKKPIQGKHLIQNKFQRMILDFDGSMTKLIQNLAGQKVKLDILQQLKMPQLPLQMKKDLPQFFAKGENFLTPIKFTNSEAVPYLRTVMMRTESNKKPLVYARSFWNPQTYQRIIKANPNIPIGFNLINQKISPFRQIQWLGSASIQIKRQEKLENIKCRSYTMTFDDGQVGCFLEEYFTEEFFSFLF